jgi:hypothetical protein
LATLSALCHLQSHSAVEFKLLRSHLHTIHATKIYHSSPEIISLRLRKIQCLIEKDIIEKDDLMNKGRALAARDGKPWTLDMTTDGAGARQRRTDTGIKALLITADEKGKRSHGMIRGDTTPLTSMAAAKKGTRGRPPRLLSSPFQLGICTKETWELLSRYLHTF